MQEEHYTWRNGKHVRVDGLNVAKIRRFVLGPVPMGWLLACRQAGPDCHLIAALILARTGTQIEAEHQKEVAVSEVFGKELQLSRYRRYRAVDDLAKAGLAVVKRDPNRSPTVRLIPWKEGESDV